MKKLFPLLLLTLLFACSSPDQDHTTDAGSQDTLSDISPDAEDSDVTDIQDAALDSDVATDADSAVDTFDAAQDAGEDTIDGGNTQDPTPLRDDAVLIQSNYEHVEAAMDRGTLATRFAQMGYTPPSGAYLLIGKISDGIQSPWIHWYSYLDTAVVFSYGTYWPASTVKLTAAVGALRTLGEYGLTSNALLDFLDDDGLYQGSAHDLITAALEVSSNTAYNRLMEICGFEEMNEELLVGTAGYPTMTLQRRYTHPTPTSNLRFSPAVDYSEGSLTGTIPQRTGTTTYASCPNEANCITLVELLDVMRRVTLSPELPALERFPFTTQDQQRLMDAMSNSPSTLAGGAQAALGQVEVYNKTGTVPGDDRLDHGLVIDTQTGERYLIALSLPYDTTTESDLALLAQRAIEALLSHTPTHPPVQTTQGSPVTVQVDDQGAGSTGRLVTITVEIPGANSVSVWANRYPLGAFSPTGVANRFSLTHEFSQSGYRQLVVIPSFNGTPSGYRRLTVFIP